MIIMIAFVCGFFEFLIEFSLEIIVRTVAIVLSIRSSRAVFGFTRFGIAIDEIFEFAFNVVVVNLLFPSDPSLQFLFLFFQC